MSRRIAVSKKVGGAHDNYPTPAWPVHRLMDEVDLPKGGKWLEPGVGDGAIVRAVTSRPGYESIDWTGIDIRKEVRGLVRPKSIKLRIGNFLLMSTAEIGQFDCAIGNPAYTIAMEVVEKARTVSPLVIMLLRLNWLGSEKRAPLFRAGAMPERVLVLPNRPSFVKGEKSSTDSCEYAWMIFGKRRVDESRVRTLGSTPEELRGVRSSAPRAK